MHGWVDSVLGVWLGQGCGLTTCWVFSLADMLGLGWGVFMYGFVYVLPMCWPWVWSSVGWMDVLCGLVW